MGGEQRLNTGRYKITGRGGRGHEFVSRGQIVEVMLNRSRRRRRWDEAGYDVGSAPRTAPYNWFAMRTCT